MKIKIITSIMILGFLNYGIAQTTQKNESDNPTIAFLGTIHFAGSSDMAGIKTGDIETPKRQEEIKALTDALALYKPTKIILEYPYGNTKLDSLYQQYLIKKHTLNVNEQQQIGFRLAAQLGHKHIYPADFKMNLPFDELTTYLESAGEMDDFQTMMNNIIIVMGELQKVYTDSSLKEVFVYMNQTKFDNLNKNLYLEYINKMGSEKNAVGTEVTATWWHRNFRIMFNIDKITEPGDRVLVIFGQGHTAIFKDFYKTRDDYYYQEILDYLKP
jgi:hypothetical protein